MSIEDHDQYLKISVTKTFLKFSHLIVVTLLTMNGWFIKRLISSIDENAQIVNTHSIEFAVMRSEMKDTKRQIGDLKSSIDILIHKGK